MPFPWAWVKRSPPAPRLDYEYILRDAPAPGRRLDQQVKDDLERIRLLDTLRRALGH